MGPALCPDLDGVPLIDFLVYRVVLLVGIISLGSYWPGCFGLFFFSRDYFFLMM